jgi:hypothetical protein
MLPFLTAARGFYSPKKKGPDLSGRVEGRATQCREYWAGPLRREPLFVNFV